jgi:uncharacterized protein YndB with AHSA1/START domain
MSAPETTDRIERSIELDADADEIWPLLIEPDGLADWLGDEVELDVRPGGSGHLIDDRGTRRDVLVTAVEPARRLAWHWWSESDELSSVEITLVPTDAGTKVTVVELSATTAVLRAPRGLTGPTMSASAGRVLAGVVA